MLTFFLGFVLGVVGTLAVLAGWAMLAIAAECDRRITGA